MLYIERYKYLIKFKIEGKQRQQNSGWCGLWFLFDGGNQQKIKGLKAKRTFYSKRNFDFLDIKIKKNYLFVL